MNDYGAIVREQEGRSAALKGGGGPTISVTANRGTITVRKDDDAANAPASKQPKGSGPKDLKNSEVKM